MKKENKNLTTFVDHLDKQYGKRGTSKRENMKKNLKLLNLALCFKNSRKDQGLTQEQF